MVTRQFRRSESNRKDKYFEAILYIVMLSLATIVGGIAGYRICDKIKVAPVRDLIQSQYNPANSLGAALERMYANKFKGKNPAEKDIGGIAEEILGNDYFEAYLEEGLKAEDLYSFSYSPPKTMVPDLLCAPNPGRSNGMKINNAHFRSNWNLIYPKPHDEWRIMITGGSSAWGLGARNNETTIGGYLEYLLKDRAEAGDPKAKVYTGAYPVWSSYKERVMIVDHMARVEPDVIISLTGLNDVVAGYDGKWVGESFEAGDVYFFRVLQKVHLLYAGKQLQFKKPYRHQRLSPEKMSKNFLRNIRLSLEGLAGTDTILIVVLQPVIQLTDKPLTQGEIKMKTESHELMKSEYDDYLRQCFQSLHEGLKTLSEENHRLFVYDFNEKIFKDCEKRAFLDTCHFGDRGNKLIANRLAQIVIEKTKQHSPQNKRSVAEGKLIESP